MRFALRSRRGPHIPVGHGAKTVVKREIEHLIEVIPRIVFEPPLIDENTSSTVLPSLNKNPTSHICRLKTVNEVKLLEKEIAKKDHTLQRCANENLRSFLLTTLISSGNGSNQKLIHRFCDLYEHARHDPTEYGEEEYHIYSKLLLKLIDVAKSIRSYPSSKKSSPSKTPIRKSLVSDSRSRVGKKIESVRVGYEKDGKPGNCILDDSETSV
ncbi:hypothetical protein RUM43_005228 [Polyplax serrata]|uniref:Uncharacterized protein n=1 Tax=Polyplax serrata TaxID=468196 RepID=A0AAN8XME8_POLSC